MHLQGSKDNCFPPTIGASHTLIQRKRDGLEIVLNIFDTTGLENQHRKPAMKLFYRGVDLIVFFFDPRIRDSFESVLRFFQMSTQNVDPQRPVKKILLANYFADRSDTEYTVPCSEAISAAFLNHATYFELFDQSQENMEKFLDVVIDHVHTGDQKGETKSHETQITQEDSKLKSSKATVGMGVMRFFRK